MNPFLKRFATDIPLMSAEYFAALMAFDLTVDDLRLAEHPALAKFKRDLAPRCIMRGDVAICPVQGALAHRPDAMEMAFDGVEDSENVVQMLHGAAVNPNVKGVLLRMDTPGGMLLGGPEIADKVAEIRQSKPVVCHVGGMGASLGYMIASQCDEIVANRSSITGSVGVIASIPDYTGYLAKMGIRVDTFKNADAKFKGAGALGTSLSDDQRANIQSQIESAFAMFKGMVLRARPWVKSDAMQGQTFRGEEAKDIGLVDRLGDENFALDVLRRRIGTNLSNT